mmetsp:Transcript_7577/g.8273  ORF Transcript_7577/g.8273 Transcript_7577/m.8273 type:complete len:252 (-) Transcript_7577:14-769(-)
MFFPYYQDDAYYMSPHDARRYWQLKRQRQMEEQRQRDIDQYYHEQERRQLVKQREEQLRRRHMKEAEHQRRLEMEQINRQQECYDSEDSTTPDGRLYARQQQGSYDGDDRTTPTTVRGSDGRIYRLVPRKDEKKSDDRETNHHQQKPSRQNQYANPPTKAGYDQNSSSAERLPNFGLRNDNYHEKRDRGSSMLSFQSLQYQKKLSKGSKSTNAGSRDRQRITIKVEDASDSEGEDEYTSKWRNRRPSPDES